MSERSEIGSNAAGLVEALDNQKLIVFGVLEIAKEDCPAGEEALCGKSAIMVGNAGPDLWAVFSKSAEFKDGLADSLNRWTERVIGTIAEQYNCRALYPFGEPFWPFQRLAQRASGIRPSPLGILIHPEYGLWHAFRAVLVFEGKGELADEVQSLMQASGDLTHPCDTCVDKPCLTACPVGAFSGEALDVKACFSHIDSTSDPKCMQLGCRARDACPIGVQYRNTDAQVRFHMKSYRS